jgi:D-2-hydroxyacid dehydrogenase (NADP+)
VTEVLVLDRRPEQFAALCDRFPQVTFNLASSPEHAEPHLASTNVLVTIGRDLTADMVDRMPALAWMQSLIAGLNFALAALARRPDVMLTTASGIHGPQMSEAALGHMLNLARNTRRSLIAQSEHRWDAWDPEVLDGKTVAIVGIGSVGEHLAGVCAALGMTVFGVSRTARSVPGITRMFGRDELADVATQVDFLVLTVPLEADTEHLIDDRILRAMKPTAYLINLARGGVVDPVALADGLKARTIAGAGLDAFEQEPLPQDSPFWGLDNVFVTAHMAGRRDRYVERALTIFEPNLRHWLAREPGRMRNVVPR